MNSKLHEFGYILCLIMYIDQMLRMVSHEYIDHIKKQKLFSYTYWFIHTMTCLKSQQLLHYTLWGSNVLRGLNLSPWFVFFVRLYDILEKVPRDFRGFSWISRWVVKICDETSLNSKILSTCCRKHQKFKYIVVPLISARVLI